MIRYINGLAALLVVTVGALPASACINDREVGRAEREFKSQYLEQPPANDPYPESASTPGPIASVIFLVQAPLCWSAPPSPSSLCPIGPVPFEATTMNTPQRRAAGFALVLFAACVGGCGGLIGANSYRLSEHGPDVHVFPMPHHLSQYEGGISLRFAMVHDVIHGDSLVTGKPITASGIV